MNKSVRITLGYYRIITITLGYYTTSHFFYTFFTLFLQF